MLKRSLWIAWTCCWVAAVGCGGQDLGQNQSGREVTTVGGGVFLYGNVMFCTGSAAVVEVRLVQGTAVVARTYTNPSGQYGFLDLSGDPAGYQIQAVVNGKVAHTRLLTGLAAGDEVPTIVLGATEPFLHGEVVWSTGTPAEVELRLVEGDTILARAYSNPAGLYGLFDLSGNPSSLELQVLVSDAIRQVVSLESVTGGQVPTIILD